MPGLLHRRVLYTKPAGPRPLVFVEVDAFVTKPEQREVLNTNTFTFVFTTEPGPEAIKRVLPITEEEGLRAWHCHLTTGELEADGS